MERLIVTNIFRSLGCTYDFISAYDVPGNCQRLYRTFYMLLVERMIMRQINDSYAIPAQQNINNFTQEMEITISRYKVITVNEGTCILCFDRVGLFKNRSPYKDHSWYWQVLASQHYTRNDLAIAAIYPGQQTISVDYVVLYVYNLQCM